MEFELIEPNLAIQNEGERHYKIAYSQALANGIFPKEVLRQRMQQFQMWTDEDEKETRRVLGELAKLQIDLDKAQTQGDDEKCVEIATKMASTRDRMFELFLMQHTVYMNSAEGMAETVKSEVIMAACTRVKATGQRYWKDYSEFVTERDENLKSTVYMQVVGVHSALLKANTQAIEGAYPETKYIKDVRESMLDREVEEKVQEELMNRAKGAAAEMEEDDAPAKPKRKRKTRGRKVATKASKSGENS